MKDVKKLQLQRESGIQKGIVENVYALKIEATKENS